MEAFTSHRGVGIPLRRSNVDTDQIIPAVYLKRITRTGFRGRAVRRLAQRSVVRAEPARVPRGSVLVAGPDFGTGSSREHAVWALMDYGIRVVISSKFADIFRGNAGKGGLVAAQVSQDDVELLWKQLENQPGLEVEVDLATQTITAGPLTVSFQIDPYIKWRLLNGLDDIALTLRHAAEIDEFETAPSGVPADHRLTVPEAGSRRGSDAERAFAVNSFRDVSDRRRTGRRTAARRLRRDRGRRSKRPTPQCFSGVPCW